MNDFKVGAIVKGMSREFRFNVIIHSDEHSDRHPQSQALIEAIRWRDKFVREDVKISIAEPIAIENLMTVNCLGNDDQKFTLELDKPANMDSHEYAKLVVGSCLVDLKRVDPYEKFICAGCDQVFQMSEVAIQCDFCGSLFCRECTEGKPWREHLNEHEE